MQFATLPGTSIRPSVICLGAGALGSSISRDESFAILDAFAEAGGNITDTAHVYAAWVPGSAGQSERTIGAWLRSRGPKGFLVGTKGAHPDLATMDVPRLTPECINRDLDESLERLGVECIDLYWLHRDDATVPVDEVIDVLNQHIHAGRLRAIGASNWTPQRIDAANAYAAQRGLHGFSASQIGWSLAELKSEARGGGGTLHMDSATMDWHRSTGFPCFGFSAQAGGYFAHAISQADEEPSEKQKAFAKLYGTDENARRHRCAHEIALRLGRSANEVALAYIWSQTFPGIAIIGPQRVQQLKDSLRAADLTLDPAGVAALDGTGHVASAHS